MDDRSQDAAEVWRQWELLDQRIQRKREELDMLEDKKELLEYKLTELNE